MALKVEELQVLIAANADQFKSELLSIHKQLEGLGKVTNTISGSTGFGGLFRSITAANLSTQLITNTISKLGRTFSNLTSSIVESGGEYARLSMINDVLARNLGITNVQLQKLRNSLADANTYGTVAEEVIRNLALSGMFEYAERVSYADARTGELETGVNALVLAMKDLAATGVMESGAAIKELTRFIQSGYGLEGASADMLAGIGNLAQEYKVWGEQNGIVGRQLDAQEQRMARIDLLVREATKSWGAYAATYQTSGKLIESIQRILKNITEIIGKALEPALFVASSAFFQFLYAVRESLAPTEEGVIGLQNTIQSFAVKVAGFFVAVARVIGRVLMMIPVIGKNFANLANFTVKPMKAQAKLAGATSDTASAMDSASKAAKKLKNELAGFDELDVINEDTGGTGLEDLANMGSIGAGGGAGDLGLEDMSEQINEFADKFTEKFDKITKAISDFLKPLKPVFEFIKKYILPHLGKFLLILGAVAIAVGVVALALKGLAFVIGILTSPITIVILAIAGLVTVFILLYQNSEVFRNMIQSIAGLVKDVLAVAFDVLGQVITFVWANVIQPAFLWIQENVLPVLEDWWDMITRVVNLIRARMPEIKTIIDKYLVVVFNNLKGVIQIVGDVISWLWENIFKPLIYWIINNAVPIVNTLISVFLFLVQVFTIIAQVVGAVVIPIIKVLWETFKIVFNTIKAVVLTVLEKVVLPILKTFWSFLTGFVIPVLQTLWAVAKLVFNSILYVVQIVWNGIRAAIQPVVDWFNIHVKPKIQEFADKIKAIWDGIKQHASNVWEGIKSAFKTGINGVIRLLNNFIGKVNSALDKISSAAQSIPGGKSISFRVGYIPELAKGGIIDKPTLAKLGEAGTEAVVPLEQNTEWIDKLASKINQGGGQTLIVKLGEDKIFDKFIEWMNSKSLTGNLDLNI